jgi:hypothetical protein
MRSLIRTSLVIGGFTAAIAGCGGVETLAPAAVGVNLAETEISLPGTGGIVPRVLVGTYGEDCVVHAGETWDLALNSPDRSLEIALNDTLADCPLKVTAVRVSTGHPGLVEFPVVPPIVLGLAYAPAPSSVNQPDPTILAFFTNVRIDGLADGVYNRDFAIRMIFSDLATSCNETAPPAIYATVTAYASAIGVRAPSYDMGFDGLRLVVDANLIVQPTSIGALILDMHPGEQPGEELKIFDEGNRCCKAYDFAEVDSIYKNDTAIWTAPIMTPGDVILPWPVFGLGGRTLPTTRTVIVKHTDGGGVYSYQVFQVVFPAPREEGPRE